MIALDFSVFAALYVALGLLVILGLWFYYDRRDKRLYEEERAKMIFHCIKCGNLYSRVGTVETARCSRCGFENARLRF